MANKKLIYLLGGYIAWTVIASLYSSKKGDDVRKEMCDSKAKKWVYEAKKVLFGHILDIHKKLFSDVSQEEHVKKTADFLGWYKETFHKFFDSSKSEITGILKEYKTLWEQDIQELSTKLQEFVKEKFDCGLKTLKDSLGKVSEKFQEKSTVSDDEEAESVVEKKKPFGKKSKKSV